MKNLRRCRSPRRGIASHLLEELESRVLLSANVLVSVSNGQLYIQGDSGSDSIVVQQNALGTTQFQVSSGNSSTTINGKAAPSTFSGANGISINTGGGNNTVAIQNAIVNAGVQITGASGNQVVTLNNVVIGGNLSLTSGGAQNSTTIEGFSSIAGNLTVNVGAGFNGQCGICWGGSTFTNANEIFTSDNTTVGNNVSISNVSGETTTTIEGGSIGNSLTVSNGGTSYGQCSFNAGCGHCGAGSSNAGDLLTMTGTTVGNNVSISNASDGNNTDIEMSTIGGDLDVNNDLNSSANCGFTACGGANLANASDAFTLNGSTVAGDVLLANVSDSATATIEGASSLNSLTVNNGVGTYGHGITTCFGTANSQGSDTLIITGVSFINNNVTVNNGATVNDTEVDDVSYIGGNLTVNDGLNLCVQSNCNIQCGGGSQCGSTCQGGASSGTTTDLFTISGFSFIGNNVSVTNASGYTSTSILDSFINGSMTATNANGTAYFDMSDSTIGVDLTFVAGTGVTNVVINNSSSIGGNAIIVAGKGSTNVTVADSTIADNATVTVARGASVSISQNEVGGVLTVN